MYEPFSTKQLRKGRHSFIQIYHS